MAVSFVTELLNIKLLATVLIITQLVRLLYAGVFNPLRKLPGPWYTNWTRLPLKLSIISGQRIYFIHDLHQRYGPIVRISPDEVAVADVESHQKIHRIGSGFDKTPWYQELNKAPRPGVFAMSDPKQHAMRRKLFARPFSKSVLRTQWESSIVEKAKLAVHGMLKEVKETGQADLLKWWTFYATDVSGHLMFGESFNMLESGQRNQYIEVLESALKGGGISSELPIARLLRFLPMDFAQTMFNNQKYLMDYAQRAVTNAHSSRTHSNIFSPMINEAEKDGGSIDDLDIQLEAANLIVAGSDTTAVTLTYLTWGVLQNPELHLRLKGEIASLPENFTEADIENLPLVNATIEETLRLYGAAPGSLPRTVPDAGITLHGHFIPGGQVVSTQSWSLHRDPGSWEEPERFNPYRFLDDAGAPHTKKSSAAFSPFGTGSRACLGVHLAYMELRYGLTYFLRECDTIQLSPSATAESMKPENYFLIAPSAHQCLVRAKLL